SAADAGRPADRAPLMAVATALVQAEVVAATPMSYWRTVGWRLARDRATLVAGGVLVLIALSALLAPGLAPYRPTPRASRPGRSGCVWRRWARPGTSWGRTSRGAT